MVITNASDFRQAFSVSRETVEKIEIYGEKIRTWQKAVNLVAPKTLDDIWHRHFADSAQLLPLIPPAIKSLADFGSGGGFPGLVLAICLQDLRPEVKISLVESDQRKAAFLRDVAGAVDNPVQILSTRIEDDATKREIGAVDLISARALAPLDRLLGLIFPFCHESTVCLFPKGRSVEDEITRARVRWSFDVAHVESRTDCSGRIAILRDVQPSP